ncbi:hypothetical protein J7481_19705 [Labrenzia sp. R4_2]|uniref:hypothetical protein n=1 Tax=Labrenzia sp. R4_2 TaxID=2821107 RepID=UPI001AD96DBB|nr:hypothetical protein [Labrenzia sp. R4_2]MBO9421743.1 hypothetical protein [Labrenzia sp. R4_2]
MAKRRGDTLTGDLLSWEPPKVEARFEEARVRAATLAGKVCRVVSEAMKEDGRSREEIAVELSDYLGEDISRDSLDAWASEARDKNNVSAYRLIALVKLLNSPEMLNELLADTEFLVVDRKYKALIERELAIETREKLNRMIDAADAEWKSRK